MAHTEYRRLPDAELEVMQALWACEGPASRADIQDKLAPGRSMAPTTLLTLLARLGEKGFVQAEKEGRAARYTPWWPGRTIWPSRAAGFSIRYAGAACPPSPRPCAAAG